jgi:hypothetical protein
MKDKLDNHIYAIKWAVIDFVYSENSSIKALMTSCFISGGILLLLGSKLCWLYLVTAVALLYSIKKED